MEQARRRTASAWFDHADGLVRVSTIHTHYHTPVSSTGAGVLVLQAAWRRGDAR